MPQHLDGLGCELADAAGHGSDQFALPIRGLPGDVAFASGGADVPQLARTSWDLLVRTQVVSGDPQCAEHRQDREVPRLSYLPRFDLPQG